MAERGGSRVWGLKVYEVHKCVNVTSTWVVMLYIKVLKRCQGLRRNGLESWRFRVGGFRFGMPVLSRFRFWVVGLVSLPTMWKRGAGTSAYQQSECRSSQRKDSRQDTCISESE